VGVCINLQDAAEGDRAMTDLTEAQKKMLTELLGECWHPPLWPIDNSYCRVCGKGAEWRSFTTSQDRTDLAEALMKVGKWGKFLKHSENEWAQDATIPEFTYWLMVENPKRFCKLVSKFMEEEK
jgi:hypothetical protein